MSRRRSGWRRAHGTFVEHEEWFRNRIDDRLGQRLRVFDSCYGIKHGLEADREALSPPTSVYTAAARLSPTESNGKGHKRTLSASALGQGLPQDLTEGRSERVGIGLSRPGHQASDFYHWLQNPWFDRFTMGGPDARLRTPTPSCAVASPECAQGRKTLAASAPQTKNASVTFGPWPNGSSAMILSRLR